MAIIGLAILVVFIVSAVWIWHCLGDMERSSKILFIIIGFLFVFIVTFIVFQFSKKGIEYENKNIENIIQNILVSLFTSANSLILLPYVSKQINSFKLNEIKVNKFRNKIILICLIFIVCLIFESGYLRETQQGILEIYHTYNNIM